MGYQCLKKKMKSSKRATHAYMSFAYTKTQSTKQQLKKTTALRSGETFTRRNTMDNISIEEVKEMLDDMMKMGFIEAMIDDDGVERYRLTELGRLEMAFQSE
jgi:hypothetical protein